MKYSLFMAFAAAPNPGGRHCWKERFVHRCHNHEPMFVADCSLRGQKCTLASDGKANCVAI
ncbi:Uu.00g091210.m01.CDS01 [Anthostomella pinea]|uniref:Uu.00g091210.m01.CDS01 n=1 Tax=Anthostomella pinea TaxID=933095 RepID=A0AAI8YKC1_9PEZI|nr:Uu.00g091210.m01.CDS01 [Anthostomella pinea]